MSDAEWKLFEDIFPEKARKGRGMPAAHPRKVLNSLLLGFNRRLAATRLELHCLNASLERQVAERTAFLSQTNEELRTALTRVRQMEGILPICCFCKKIRENNGHWSVLENYIGSHSNAQFSHCYYPECARKHYPEYCG